MTKADDRRLTRITKIALALPDATREDHPSHAIFRVKKKVFAYWLDDHHTDGIFSVAVKVAPGESEQLVKDEPAVFYSPAYIGSRGWVGVRLDGKSVDWARVAALIEASHAATAAKKKPRR